ncbi:cell division protein ZapA [Chelatococcus asaccharovorans]|uniref:Cell division protein ZapA n=1 Tax=Chelatococcus asaccharovorans TaxID=28210 RepID=A0A2V3UBZ8_9HYPH|nr:cell division protein ZapA [Chelatococcus asaccharovorans]MBS7705269.1 cell division protein ZapA [Chelatococcus asaccharovorans]PXW60328.1 cell division protein ZapA [Chelatococcus asaccharovorans]CAH1654339.1 Cell division protein ZapA [Chelatococcus asaccharovorans]CAH1685775.1 Cell division protein ZapA [Chelatococcus asaccharovorans]
MAEVNVSIAGRNYRMACGPGEEEHIAELAGLLDGRILELRQSFGEIGDMRLHVMAALTIADELSEAKRGMANLEAEVAKLKDAVGAGDERVGAMEAELTEAVASAAARIERIARELNTPQQNG